MIAIFPPEVSFFNSFNVYPQGLYFREDSRDFIRGTTVIEFFLLSD